MALAASLLDKLIDNDPQSREDKDFPLTQQSLIDNLLRDLESMLNSRIGWREVPFELKEANKSILNYGMPDFSSMPFSSQQGQGQLCGIVRAAIREFEPRLSSLGCQYTGGKECGRSHFKVTDKCNVPYRK
ncbi:type VI secretion system baseplate subunit TssE [Vibrio harveyi]|nr:type VI secretion system baseplate subunit TssE [Vibrio harveyi]